MKAIIITTLLAATVLAAPNSKTTTMDAAAAVAPTVKPVPTCKFDPVKGEYICPFVSKPLVAPEEIAAKREAEVSGVPTSTALEDAAAKDVSKIEVKAEDSAEVQAADCAKCQRDWEDCMKVSFPFPPHRV